MTFRQINLLSSLELGGVKFQCIFCLGAGQVYNNIFSLWIIFLALNLIDSVIWYWITFIGIEYHFFADAVLRLFRSNGLWQSSDYLKNTSWTSTFRAKVFARKLVEKHQSSACICHVVFISLNPSSGILY
jgi:hypothetical protein